MDCGAWLRKLYGKANPQAAEKYSLNNSLFVTKSSIGIQSHQNFALSPNGDLTMTVTSPPDSPRKMKEGDIKITRLKDFLPTKSNG